MSLPTSKRAAKAVKNFVTKMVDEQRASMHNCIHVKGGRAYATNGHLLIGYKTNLRDGNYTSDGGLKDPSIQFPDIELILSSIKTEGEKFSGRLRLPNAKDEKLVLAKLWGQPWWLIKGSFHDEIKKDSVIAGFDGKYLAFVSEFLECEEVTAEIVDDLSPALFAPAKVKSLDEAESFVILMPMRV